MLGYRAPHGNRGEAVTLLVFGACALLFIIFVGLGATSVNLLWQGDMVGAFIFGAFSLVPLLVLVDALTERVILA